MNNRNIFLVALLVLLTSCTPEFDSSSYDEWLGEKFNQEILWDVDSLAFRRAEWATKDVVSGVQMRHSQVKMWESVQTISFITYSPNLFNTCLGWKDELGTTGEIASKYDGALFAINGGNFQGTKPADYFMLDGTVVTGTAAGQATSDGLIGLTASPLGVDMKITKDVAELSGYTSAMVTGPVLLAGGVEQEFPAGEFYDTRMARSIIGVSDNGNYIMGVIDGGVSGKADGATVKEAAYIARMMGLKDAVLLAGYENSTLWSSQAGVLNAPSTSDGKSKKIANIIYVTAGTARVTGEGTQSSPYILENHVHMTQMRTLTAPDKEVYFKLGADIDMSAVKAWTPLNYEDPFTRKIHLDGNGYTISNFAPADFINEAGDVASYPSLFGVLYGSCKNLTVKDSKILGTESTPSCGILGGFVGTTGKSAEIEDVHIINCEVVGGSCLGAFGGQSRDASYKNCSAEGIKLVSAGTDVGGFVGKSAAVVSFENCTADVHISASKNPGSNMRYGGLLGYAATAGNTNTLSVINCSTSGTIFNNAYTCNCTAGVVAYVGTNEAVFNKCYSTVELVCERTNATGSGGKLSNAGGICGTVSPAVSCVIENCYASGDMNVWQCSAGIAGRHEKGVLTITDCYSTGDILGYSGLGGILGQSKTSITVNLTRCFAWNPSIVAFRDGADKYSSGAVAGCASGTDYFSGCFRNPDMVFTDPFRSIQTHGDIAGGTPEGDANQHAYDASPSAEKTLTDAAKKAGWSASVWDFTGPVPVLK